MTCGASGRGRVAARLTWCLSVLGATGRRAGTDRVCPPCPPGGVERVARAGRGSGGRMSVHGVAVLDIDSPRPPGSTRPPAPVAPALGERDARVAPVGGGRVR